MGKSNARTTKAPDTTIVKNKKAYHDYEIIESYEAGIVLRGTEIKSIRQKKVSIGEAYAVFKQSELFLINMHIAHYEQGNINNHDPLRTRKLLLHKKEIDKLIGKTKESGLTLVPLKMYYSKNIAKVLIGLCRGKKQYDKRQDMKKKDASREMDRYKKAMR